jgi:hypothetical protein
MTLSGKTLFLSNAFMSTCTDDEGRENTGYRLPPGTGRGACLACGQTA